jgi:hypothetical protein
MRPSRLGSVAIVVMALSVSPFAQWPRYQTPGVPRTASGQVDLDAPTPRTHDGKPDMSGNWVRAPGPGRGQGQGLGQTPPPAPPGTPPVATFGNVGAAFPDGLPFQPSAKELLEKRRSTNSKENPDANCLPMGFLQFHTHGQPRKMIQAPGLTTIIYEANYGLRFIYTDGRTLPPQGEPQPWWYGYSVGRWEGDTLVVESNNFRDDGWLDVRGSPYTDQLKLTERFRRPSFGRLEIDVTIDDPKAYTKPFTVRVDQQISVDTEIIEFICNENQQFRKLIKID